MKDLVVIARAKLWKQSLPSDVQIARAKTVIVRGHLPSHFTFARRAAEPDLCCGFFQVGALPTPCEFEVTHEEIYNPPVPAERLPLVARTIFLALRGARRPKLIRIIARERAQQPGPSAAE